MLMASHIFFGNPYIWFLATNLKITQSPNQKYMQSAILRRLAKFSPTKFLF